jgi:Xaa-Pro aminopeptidase
MSDSGSIKKRISNLQKLLKEENLDFYLIPSEDAHKSEYTARYWHARAYFSGFEGSAGILLVCTDEVLLWTDGRYWLEASQVLKGTGVMLMKEGDLRTPHLLDYIKQKYPSGAKGSMDARVCTIQKYHEYDTVLSSHKIEFKPSKDLLSLVWKDRPALPEKEIREISASITGETRKQRISRCKSWLKEQDVEFCLISALDEIAWILNLRGSDVNYNPIFYGFLLLGVQKSVLFVAESSLDEALVKKLDKLGISVESYANINSYLKDLKKDTTIILNPINSSIEISQNLAHCRRILLDPPFALWKAQKTKQELNELRDAMIKDGIALIQCFYEIEQKVDNSEIFNEIDVAKMLIEKRSEQDGYISESFNAIVGFQDHGAIIHYAADDSSAYDIYGDGILLIDSGAQYENGTTDITRVLAFGIIPDEVKKAFTLVVKGHIALNNIRFPQGTSGAHLDILARQFLWHEGMNYYHGTGHGVGFTLNVHEGPQRIAPLNSDHLLTPGMILSNEPGYYKEGQFGVRFENLICIQNCVDKPGFMEFECLSLFPIETKLLDLALLDDSEILWINSYQEKVFKLLSPGLEKTLKTWLKEKCRAI